MFRLFISLLALANLTGCAGFLHGDSQAIQVTTWCGQQMVPAACVAENSRGSWQFQAPGEVVVQKDADDLNLTCKSAFHDEVSAPVPALLNLSVLGNVLVGGVVGAGVDIYSGAGFAYSRDVRVSYPSCN